MAQRTRVLELAPPRRGVLALGCGLGIAYGLAGSWVINVANGRRGELAELMSLIERRYGAPGVITTMVGVWVPIPLLMIWLILRVQQRLKSALLVGLACGVGQAIGVLTFILHDNPETLLLWVMRVPWKSGPGGPPLYVVGILLGVFGAVGTACGGVVHLLRAWLGRQVEVQNGTMCWTCGYDLGDSKITRCPECGEEHRAGRPPRSGGWRVNRIARWLTARGRVVLALAVVVAGIVIGRVVWVETVPALRFAYATPSGGGWAWTTEVWMWQYYQLPDGGQQVSRTPALVWWLPDGPGLQDGIAVQFVARPTSGVGGVGWGMSGGVGWGGEPHMYVCRAVWGTSPNLPSGWAPVVHSGSGSVRASLDARQATWVLEHREVPAGLIEAIKAKAAAAGWTAGTTTKPTDGTVDARAFFPAGDR